MLKKSRKKHVQLDLESARKPDKTHGGWRPNAGRKRVKGSVSHDARPNFNARFPKHVTLRLLEGVRSIATDYLMKTIRQCIRAAHKPTFRIVEFNVLTNHLHLITEAEDKATLARGVQGFEVSLVKRLNAAMKRKGKLTAHRYHARELTNPTQVRNALRYVLLNRKHHAAEKKFSKTWFDPSSSAAWFDGWASPLYANSGWQYEVLHMEKPTANATTWLLSTGWKRLGLLKIDDAPS